MKTLLLLALLCQDGALVPEAGVQEAVEETLGDGPIDLTRVEALAEANSPVPRLAQSRIASAEGQAVQARLYPNPRLDSGNPQTIAGASSVYTVGVTQPIVTAGKRKLDVQAAGVRVQQANIAYTRDRFDLLTQVRQRFYEVMAAERVLTVYAELIDIETKGFQTAQNLRRAGEGTQTDVLLTSTELQRAIIAEQNARTLLEGSRRQLSTLIGLPDVLVKDVVDTLLDPIPEFSEQEVKEFVTSQVAEIRLAELEVVRNQVLLRRARAQAVPNFDLTGGYQFAVNAPNNQAVVGIVMPIPVWDRNQGNILSARADIVGAAESRSILRNELLREAVDAFARYRASKQMAERLGKEVIPNARQAQRIVRDSYEKGIVEVSRLLQAQRAQAEASLAYNQALSDAWKAAAEIAGLLQQEDFP
jgi:cobalt-zinc-cadmium efflux system outer membrane protein